MNETLENCEETLLCDFDGFLSFNITGEKKRKGIKCTPPMNEDWSIHSEV